MAKKDFYLPVDWDRPEWIGNPNNQKIVAEYQEDRYHVGLRVQDFRCPRFIKHPYAGTRSMYLTVMLETTASYQHVFVMRSWARCTPGTMERAEHIFSNLVAIASKVLSKRPKDMELFINRVADLKRLP